MDAKSIKAALRIAANSFEIGQDAFSDQEVEFAMDRENATDRNEVEHLAHGFRGFGDTLLSAKKLP